MFCYTYKEIAQIWHETSDYLVVLNIANEEELIKLMNKAEELNIKTVGYREADLNNEYTAIALEPGPKTKKLVQNLKLALS